MSLTGSWYVLCSRDRLVSLVDIAPRLAKLRDARVGEVDPDYMEIVVDDSLTGNVATIEVFVDDEPDVLVESGEFAEKYRDRAERDAIAAADVRYAITWELECSDETYNTRAVVAEVLAKASGGVVLDITEGRLVWSAAE